MEPFRFIHFHQHFPDIFLQSSSLTISLLYNGWTGLWFFHITEKGHFYHWNHLTAPCSILTFCLSLCDNALLKPRHLNKSEIHWSMVQQAGSYRTRIPSHCVVRLSHVTCLDQWIVRRNGVTRFWQKLQEPVWGSFFLCPDDWQHPYWQLQQPETQHEDDGNSTVSSHPSRIVTEVSNQPLRLLGLGEYLLLWCTLAYPERHKGLLLCYWVRDCVAHQRLKRSCH